MKHIKRLFVMSTIVLFHFLGMLDKNEAGLFTSLLFTLEVCTVFNSLKEIVEPDDL